jgi:hypothetical protein
MNSLRYIPAFAGMLLLSACAEMDSTGPTYSYGQVPIENKVGPHGELISPDCTDWTASPTTNYSNARQSNIGCATVTNLGLMLEDPRDLERGASGGHVVPDASRNRVVIDNYRTNATSDIGQAPPVDGAQ